MLGKIRKNNQTFAALSSNQEAQKINIQSIRRRLGQLIIDQINSHRINDVAAPNCVSFTGANLEREGDVRNLIPRERERDRERQRETETERERHRERAHDHKN